MKCIECGRFNRGGYYCQKYGTKIEDPSVDTHCKFFTKEFVQKGSGRQTFGSAEFRNKDGYEVVGGLLHTTPYWYKEKNYNKKHCKKNNVSRSKNR